MLGAVGNEDWPGKVVMALASEVTGGGPVLLEVAGGGPVLPIGRSGVDADVAGGIEEGTAAGDINMVEDGDGGEVCGGCGSGVGLGQALGSDTIIEFREREV
jgi:hypothetical protein